MIEDNIYPYEILKEIGRGAFANVYKGRNKDTG